VGQARVPGTAGALVLLTTHAGAPAESFASGGDPTWKR
jgi:hypothetical protein